MRYLYKFIFLFTVAVATHATAFSQAPNWGVADTLEHYSIGPGVMYSKVHFKAKPLLIYFVTIDLKNQYNKIEQKQSRNQVPDLLRQTVPTQCKNNTYPGHRSIFGVNHDFFSYEHGIGIGLNIGNGEIVYGNGSGRSLMTITEDKIADVIYPVMDCKVKMPNGEFEKIDFINTNALGLNGDCILFNHYNAEQLTAPGLYLKIKPQGKWMVNGPEIPCQVLEVSNTPLQSTDTEYVIYVRGVREPAFQSQLKANDQISISTRLLNGKFGTPMNNIMEGFHGYPSIAYQGQLHQGEYNDFEGGREYEVASRTMVGMSKDGKKLYIVVVEKSSLSSGVNCIDLANFMLSKGAWNVVNFDSGGSAQMAVNSELVNYPSGGSERPVEDTFQAVSLAPESNATTSYSFITPSLNLPAASVYQTNVFAYNEYSEILRKSESGMQFTCEPASIGSVDEKGIFHAGMTSGTGKIIAEKNGIKAELNVNIMPLTSMTCAYGNILIDDVRQFPILVKTTVGNTTYAIDPSAITWINSNPACCTIKNGVLEGIVNGEALITGKLNDLEQSFKVVVEIASDNRVHDDYANMSQYTVLSTGAANIKYSYENLPFGWENGANMHFNYVGGRVTNIEMKKLIQFYGIPDSVSFQMNVSGNIINEMQLYLQSNTSALFKTIVFKPKTSEDQVFTIPFAENGLAYPVEYFPISLNKIKYVLNPTAVYAPYTISLRNLHAHYPAKIQTGVEQTDSSIPQLSVMRSGSEIYLNYSLAEHSSLNITLWNSDGRLVQMLYSGHKQPGVFSDVYSLKCLTPGVYFVRMIRNSKIDTVKFVIL